VSQAQSKTAARRVALLICLTTLLAAPASWAQNKTKPSKPTPDKAAARSTAAPSSPSSPSAPVAASSAVKPGKAGFTYTVGPAPTWVVAAELPSTVTVEPAPMHYRYIDEQVRVEGRSMAEYTRVTRVVNQTAGLPVASQIELEFDPSYQTLTLHHLEVVRQGSRSNRLDTQRIELLQREKGLEQSLYDGRATLSVVLNDIRVGDEIDFAYTVSGSNPVFAGQFVHHTWLSSHRGPVATYQVRLLAPLDRNIQTRVGPTDTVSQSKTLGNFKETIWRRNAVPVQRPEAGAPAAIWQAELISFSEFADWAAVAQWGHQLFSAQSAAPSARVAAKVAEIKAGFATPAAQVREALRFTQQEVRYFGVEIGTSTHQPTAPETVLERRFGDCKDKVALLGALLQGLGVVSTPVLVSTRHRGDVPTLLASPLAFDHVIARVQLEGRSYLLDPTRAHQRGPLASRESVGLDWGLNLAPNVKTLSKLASAADVLRMRVDDHITVASFKSPPTLVSRVTYHNDLAEGVQQNLAAQGLQSLADALTAPYLRVYPKLKRVGAPSLESTDEDNALTIVQSFELPEFWRFPEQRVLVADVVQWAAVEWLIPPKTEQRRSALMLPMQGLFRHNTRVDFAQDVWNKPSSNRLEEGDSHFNVRTVLEGGVRSAEFSADVRIMADRVEPAQWQAFSAQLNKTLPKLGSQMGAPALSQQQQERLASDAKALEDALRSQRVKSLTPVQTQSHYRALVLKANLDADRLTPELRAQALVARGIALDNIGRNGEAAASFDEAVRLLPDSFEALNGAAVNAFARGDTQQAVAYADRALSIQPRDGSALHNRAMAHHLAGLWPKAQADWQASLNERAMQRRGYPLLWLALASKRAGVDTSTLLQTYPRENWPTDWPRPLLDAAFGHTTPESVMVAAKASKTPLETQTEAFFYMGEKLYAEGNTPRARELWRKALDLGVTEFVEFGAAKQRLDSTR
jgi:lipoprotein NlpI